MDKRTEGKREVISVSIRKFMDEIVYRIDLDAEYQREKIWPQDKQELLLDSIIKDIDIPKLYLVQVENRQYDYECIDGKQRISTLIRFFNPEKNEIPLKVDVVNRKYTFAQLKTEHPKIASFMENYKLDISILKSMDDGIVREIFRRLQLGIPLNAGELLKSRSGNMRDFIFKEIGKNGPFLRNTKLSDRRFSRELTLSQICINSFSKAKSNEFVKARREDIENFFENYEKIDTNDENLKRIRKVLEIMDKSFGDKAKEISSRSIAVSAYLFIEELYTQDNKNLIPKFVEFYLNLLDAISEEMKRLRDYEKPNNQEILDNFQKYILQASVEEYSIQRRHDFLCRAFGHYVKSGKIIGSK